MYEVTHNGKVIILSVDQLHSHSEYRKACIAQANESPRPIAPAIWADMVDNLLPALITRFWLIVEKFFNTVTVSLLSFIILFLQIVHM